MDRFNKNQTSFFEQALFYYVVQFFQDAINRAIVFDNIEADIYIPSKKCAVEYDGFYWHRNKEQRDNEKNRLLNENGITIIRVRDVGLPILQSFRGITIFHKTKSTDLNAFHIYEIVQQVLIFLSDQCDDPIIKKQIAQFELTHAKFLEDCPDINSFLHRDSIPDSISQYYGIEYWDYNKNKRLNPNNISISYSQPVFFTCKEGNSLFLQPVLWLSEKKPEKYKQECPRLADCEYDCSIRESYIYDYLAGEKSICELDVPKFQNLLSKSSITVNCLKKRFSTSDVAFISRFDFLFLKHNGKMIEGTYPVFLGKPLYCVKDANDLDLLKLLFTFYPGIEVLIAPSPFDNSDDTRKAYCDYWDWLFEWTYKNDRKAYVMEKEYFHYNRIASAYINGVMLAVCEKSISKNFAHLLLKDFVQRNSKEFKYEKTRIKLLIQQITNT